MQPALLLLLSVALGLYGLGVLLRRTSRAFSNWRFFRGRRRAVPALCREAKQALADSGWLSSPDGASWEGDVRGLGNQADGTPRRYLTRLTWSPDGRYWRIAVHRPGPELTEGSFTTCWPVKMSGEPEWLDMKWQPGRLVGADVPDVIRRLEDFFSMKCREAGLGVIERKVRPEFFPPQGGSPA